MCSSDGSICRAARNGGAGIRGGGGVEMWRKCGESSTPRPRLAPRWGIYSYNLGFLPGDFHLQVDV